MVRIAPSILAADFSHLYDDVSKVDSVELLHLDVMDGHFVPNISFGPPVIQSLRQVSDLYFDTHLMIEQPTRYVEAFGEAGSDRLTVHVETGEDTQSAIDAIHDHDMDAGVAINPDTELARVEPFLDAVEVVTVMSVQPGFGGQEFKPATLERIERIAAQSDVEIEVDGGVDAGTGPPCVEAGADTLVIGSSLFGQSDPGQALQNLRGTIGIDTE